MRLSFLGLCLVAGSVHAGVVIDSSIEIQGSAKQTSRAFLEGDELRLELKEAGSDTPKRFLLFRGKEKKIWVVDVAQKTYTVVTRETFKQISGQINQLAQMLAKNPDQMKMMLDVMPPDQRNQVEAAIEAAKPGKKGAAKKAPKLDRGPEAKIGEWECTRWSDSSKPTVRVDFCATPYEKLGMKVSDMTAYVALAEMLEDGVFQAFGGDSISLWTKNQIALGFPVETTITDKNGAGKKNVTRALKIERKSLDKSLFKLDATYKELNLSNLPARPIKDAAGKRPEGSVPLPPPDK